MNELINTSQTLTMSSREIAELVEKRHDVVKLSMERLAEKNIIGLPPLVEYLDSLGRPAKEYRIGKRDSYIVVAQLSPEFTAKLVDRWQELESQTASQAISIPKTLPEALRLAADLAEAKAKLEAELEEAQPSIEFAAEIASSETEFNIPTAAKMIFNGSVKETQLRKWLKENKWLLKDRSEASAWAIGQGLMRQRPEKINGFVYSVPVLTGKGLETCRHLYRTGELFATTPKHGIKILKLEKAMQ